MNINIKHFKSELPEIEVFRHLRTSAPLTTRQMAALLGCHATMVTHWETGRQRMTKARRTQYMKIFKLSEEGLAEYLSGTKAVPISYRNECLLLVDKMTPEKLQAIYPILVNMAR